LASIGDERWQLRKALIISKIDPPNVYDIVFVHPTIVVISHPREG